MVPDNPVIVQGRSGWLRGSLEADLVRKLLKSCNEIKHHLQRDVTYNSQT